MGSTQSDNDETASSRSSSTRSSSSSDATTYGPPDGHLAIAPGQALREFTIDARLGRGQFGILYSVKEDDQKALKVFRCVDDPDEQDHIDNERRLLAGFPPDNDHVLRFFDHFEHGEDVPHTVFVVERMASDLFHVMETGLDVPMGRRLARQLLRAVAFLGEESGLIHFDLKPENVLVRGDGVDTVLKLCDFGTCRDHTEDEPEFGKTWEYRAPEVVLGYETPTHAADKFSVGCILYELFIATYGQTGANDVLFDVRSVSFETLLDTDVDEEEDDEIRIDHKHAYLFQEILGPVPRPYLLRCSKNVRFDARGQQIGLQLLHAVERCPLSNYLECDGVPEEHIPDMAGFLSTLLVYVPEKRVSLLDLLDHPLVA